MSKHRRAVLGLSIGAALVGAIGTLGTLAFLGPDPEAIKAEFREKLKALDQRPEADIIGRDRAIEELLLDERYPRHARALYLSLDKTHRRVHEAAATERQAEKEVPSFLARSRDGSGTSALELSRLWDESQALLGKYGGTHFKAELGDASRRLEAAMGKIAQATPLDVFELLRQVHRRVDEGHFAPAYDLIKKFKERNAGLEGLTQLSECEQQVLRKAELAVQKLLGETAQDHSPGAKSRLQQILRGPDFKDLPLPILQASAFVR
jgi:hypothetical protein